MIDRFDHTHLLFWRQDEQDFYMDFVLVQIIYINKRNARKSEVF